MTPNEQIVNEIVAQLEATFYGPGTALVVVEALINRGITDLADVAEMVRLIHKELKKKKTRADRDLEWPLISRVNHYAVDGSGRIIGEILQYGRPNNPHYRWAYISTVDQTTSYTTTRRQATAALEAIDTEHPDHGTSTDTTPRG